TPRGADHVPETSILKSGSRKFTPLNCASFSQKTDLGSVATFRSIAPFASSCTKLLPPGLNEIGTNPCAIATSEVRLLTFRFETTNTDPFPIAFKFIEIGPQSSRTFDLGFCTLSFVL